MGALAVRMPAFMNRRRMGEAFEPFFWCRQFGQGFGCLGDSVYPKLTCPVAYFWRAQNGTDARGRAATTAEAKHPKRNSDSGNKNQCKESDLKACPCFVLRPVF